MSRFVDNVNTYLNCKKIKQTYVSMRSGIENRKLSRILSGVQDVNSTDMDKIAEALGRTTTYFLQERFVMEKAEEQMWQEVAFYAGEPSARQKELAQNLLEFIECADEILYATEDVIAAVTEW